MLQIPINKTYLDERMEKLSGLAIEMFKLKVKKYIEIDGKNFYNDAEDRIKYFLTQFCQKNTFLIFDRIQKGVNNFFDEYCCIYIVLPIELQKKLLGDLTKIYKISLDVSGFVDNKILKNIVM